jgi:hypothetical protein
MPSSPGSTARHAPTLDHVIFGHVIFGFASEQEFVLQ